MRKISSTLLMGVHTGTTTLENHQPLSSLCELRVYPKVDPRETLGPRETGLKTVTAAVFMMERINPMIDEQMHCYTYKLVF